MDTRQTIKKKIESITFILPHPAAGPTGGYKVVYEYANRFAADGWEVYIVYSGSIFWKEKPFMLKVSNIVRFVEHKVKGFGCRSWFELNKNVKEKLSLSMNHRHVPQTDVYVATSPYTAFYLKDYPIEDSRKFYLIQDYENWGPGLEQLLEPTYKANLKKIVISKWLQKMLKDKYHEDSVLIPNGFDFNKFTLDIPFEVKDPNCISMLYHHMDRKDCSTGFKALDIVKQKIPQLRVKIFGVPEKPDLPDWYEYYRMPDPILHNRINNEAAIFIGSSKTEGWGLTVGEAMICGQAVCCTDNDGYREMAVDNETALLSPVGDAEALANNILKMIKDEDLRIRIAKAGNEFIQRFRWEESFNKFKEAITAGK